MFEGKNFALIKANRLFAGSAQKLKIGITNKELLSAGTGDLIFKKDDDADSIYLIISGEVKLEIPGIFKKPVIVTKSQNDFFGEKEFFDKAKRKGNAEATSNCQLCVLNREKIDKLISLDKKIYFNLFGLNDEVTGIGEGFAYNPGGVEDLGETLFIEVETPEADPWKDRATPSETVTADEDLIKETADLLESLISDDLGFEIKDNLTAKDIFKPADPSSSDADDIEVDFDFLKELEKLDKPGQDSISDEKEEEITIGVKDFSNDEEELPIINEETTTDAPPADDYTILEEVAFAEEEIPAAEKDILIDDDDISLDELDLESDEDQLLPDIENLPDKPEPFVEESLTAGEIISIVDDIDIENLPDKPEPFVDELTVPVKQPVPIENLADEIPAEDELKEIPQQQEPQEITEIAAELENDIPEEKIIEEAAAILPSDEIVMTEDDLLKSLLSEPENIEQEVNELVTEDIPAVEKESAKTDTAVSGGNSIYQNELSEEVDEMTAAQFKLLLEAAQKINSSIKLDETLESVLDAAKKLTGAEHGYLFLFDRDANELWAKALNKEIDKETRIKIGQDVAGKAAEKNEVINLKNAYDDPRFNKERDSLDGTKTKSLLCFPILSKTGLVSAVLQLTNSAKGEFTKSDEEALSALSMNISLALENAELIEKQLQNDRLSSMGKMANFLIQDIKKPVLTIKYYAEHIKKKEVSNDVVQVMNMLIEQSNAVVDLVQTTLSYSEGKGIMRAQPVRLSTALNDIFNLLAEYVESRHVNLYKKYEADAVVNIDKREFYQACFQIVKNACDAMPGGGDVYVLVKIEHSEVKIEFKDSGIGIPESIKGKIFEPFMSHGKKQGVGLGLAISEKIIKDHGGNISFESEIGEGTTFIISLPYMSVV